MHASALGFLRERGPRRRPTPLRAAGRTRRTRQVERVERVGRGTPRWARLALARKRAHRALLSATWVMPRLLISGAPRTLDDARYLRTVRVRAVVCMLEAHEPRLDAAAYDAEHVLELPTPDYTSPSAAQLERAIEFIDAHRQRGAVLVHCKSGVGRSAVCAVAYAAARLGLLPEEAHRRLRARRRISAYRWLGGAVAPQWRVLHAAASPPVAHHAARAHAGAAVAEAEAEAAGLAAADGVRTHRRVIHRTTRSARDAPSSATKGR